MVQRDLTVMAVLVLCFLGGCKPNIDPSLQPFVGPEKDLKLFLSKPVDEQILIYLRVAALPGHPADYTLGPFIAISDGDIGRVLANRMNQEKNPDRIASLIRLAGDYCSVNKNCIGEEFLGTATTAAARLLPKEHVNAVDQSLGWVSKGIAGHVAAP